MREVAPRLVGEPLRHGLAPHYAALRRLRDRRAFEQSPLHAEIADELARVLAAVERGAWSPGARGLVDDRRLRVAAWNIRRGLALDGICAQLVSDPLLREADVLLLVEVDHGMARSGHRLVAREIAERLEADYAFGVSYLALVDDAGENPGRVENTTALAGAAIVSRVPIARVENVALPILRDKFDSRERRLGHKRALVAELTLPSGPLTVGAAHLDATASPHGRAQQLGALLAAATATGSARVLVGGDLNTTTYDHASSLSLARDLFHKLFVTGFDGTVANYLTPERRYETPLFATLAQHGFTVDGFNDRARGTLDYDVGDPYVLAKCREAVGGLLTRWLVRRLRPWNGLVSARLDWFAGRGLTPLGAWVVPPQRDGDGRPVSDHAAIVVDVAV